MYAITLFKIKSTSMEYGYYYRLSHPSCCFQLPICLLSLSHQFRFSGCCHSAYIYFLLFFVSLVINIGMWLERYNIVITSLSKDFLPSNWAPYTPTITDIGVFAGTIGLFATGVLLFMRYIPMLAISEIKGVVNIGSKKED